MSGTGGQSAAAAVGVDAAAAVGPSRPDAGVDSGSSATPDAGSALSGANLNLKPETATTWSVGADWEPLDNLRLSLTRSNSGSVFASLYRVSGAWAEGTSDAGIPGGSGAPA